MRKEFYPDFAQEYLTDGIEAGDCPLLSVGNTFLYEGGAKMPDGFCPWAWIDIYRSVSAIVVRFYLQALEPKGRPNDRMLHGWSAPRCVQG